MKTSTSSALLFILCITGSFIVSCSKDNDNNSDCRIITITETGAGGTIIRNITYNNDGKISTLNSTGSLVSNKVFTYSGNTLIINSTDGGGAFSSRDSVTLDSKGRPVNIRQFYDQSGTNWSNFSFEYNGNNLAKYHQTSGSSSVPETYVATYSNGNMIGLQSTSGNITLEYFTDKRVVPGDYLEVLSLVQYGVTVYPHKNLVKTISSSGSITNFNYEMNGDGQVAKVTATSGSSVTTLTYQYQCD